MSAKLEQIDLLRERTKVSYEDAKDALEKSNNDIVEALIYLEKQKKIKKDFKQECKEDFTGKVKSILRKGNKVKLVISKNETTVLNVCLNIAVPVTVFFFPLAASALAVAVLTNHKIRIKNESNEDMEVNKVFDKMSNVVKDVKENFKSDICEDKGKGTI